MQPRSKSTNVSEGHICLCNSFLVTHFAWMFQQKLTDAEGLIV